MNQTTKMNGPKEPEELADSSSEEKKVGKFTRGDHMVHILLQTGRKFQSINDNE